MLRIANTAFMACIAASVAGCTSGRSSEPAPPSTGACATLAGEHTIQVGDTARAYIVEVGPEVRDHTPAPLLFIWHGFGGFGRSIVSLIEADQWPQAIRIAPKGLPRTFPQFGDTARLGWQVRAGELDDRDLRFFDALIAKLGTSDCIDPARVFTTGFSNGGFFSNVLACHRPEVVKAAAPIGGGGPFTDTCKAAIPILIHHGTEDRVVPYKMAQDSYQFWRRHNGCPAAADAPPTGCASGAGCGADTRLCSAPVGHRLPPGTQTRIADFFRGL